MHFRRSGGLHVALCCSVQTQIQGVKWQPCWKRRLSEVSQKFHNVPSGPDCSDSSSAFIPGALPPPVVTRALQHRGIAMTTRFTEKPDTSRDPWEQVELTYLHPCNLALLSKRFAFLCPAVVTDMSTATPQLAHGLMHFNKILNEVFLLKIQYNTILTVYLSITDNKGLKN